MPVIGSSSIIPSASRGPQGPTGASGGGFTGGTGPTGPTGPIGITGTYVVSTYHIDPNLFLTLSDGTEIQIEGLKGNTGETSVADGVNSGSGIGIFKEVSGITFWFKGISAEGSLIVYETENTIGISGDRVYQEGATAEISDRLRFAYLSHGNTADVSGLTFDTGLTGTVIFGHGPTGNRWSYDPEEIVVPISEIESEETVTIYGEICEGDCGQTAGRGVGIQLGVTAGTVYEIQTPIGIAGFTGEFSPEELINFTILLKGNALWDFPANLYFDKQDRFFSCGTDVLNILSEDGGVSWYGTVSARGYGTDDCDSVYGVGSCCYTDNGGNLNCRDYITEETCNNVYNSISWNPLSTCADNCGNIGGVCCSPGGDWGLFGAEGICNDNIGPNECAFFYGKFYDTYKYVENTSTDLRLKKLDEPMEIICGGQLPCSQYGCANEGQGFLYGDASESLSNTLCVGSCDEQLISCCKNGKCIGDNSGSTFLGLISPVSCRYVFGGVPVLGELCGQVDCCDYIEHEGACCRQSESDSSEGSCNRELYSTCVSDGGVFMGPETHCLGQNGGENEVNCCFGEGGACCKNGTCSYPVYENVCESIGGVFYGFVDSCDELDNVYCSPNGACCQEDVCSLTSQTLCYGAGGIYLGNGTICEEDTCETAYGCCCFDERPDDSTCISDTPFTGTFEECEDCQGVFTQGVQCGDDDTSEDPWDDYPEFECPTTPDPDITTTPDPIPGPATNPFTTFIENVTPTVQSTPEISDTTMVNSYVKLPDGTCVWMMCGKDCPFPPC